MTTVLFLCTGNAARSVMAAAMMRSTLAESSRNDVNVLSAGTHSIPGLPMSTRTRTALSDHGVVDRDHLSSQLEQPMVDAASVIAIFEPMHLSYMRKKHPEASAKVASLPRLARDLTKGPASTFDQRLDALDLAKHSFEDWEEVIDPAGGDLPVFQASAAEIAGYLSGFVAKLTAGTHAGS